MIPEVGQFALILALVLALAQAVLPMVGAARGDSALMAFGRAAALLQFAFIALSFACLMGSFADLDFSVRLVAEHSHSTQPLVYRLGATWGNHEGSMLLWVLILTLFGAMVAWFGDNLREALQARVLAVQAMIGAAFFAFMLFTSNPFARLSPAPADGAELNPVLQDPGLIVHPPLLYLGYVGFSVTFSFAVAALIEGRVDAAWARWVRPWVLAAWVCLTAGIALGSFWAYYTLGWGGWWFWDPVENASLMPWLLGTALLHSALVLERRGALISWTILLGILTFSLSLIGTFLVRSGILTSVHAFAVDATRGIFILAMIVAATGGALALFAWRAPAMKSGALFTAVSREGGLTVNNLLLMGATATVFLGTFYPVIMEAVSTDKISVGPPFYKLTFVPIVLPLLALVTIGPVLSWKRDAAVSAARRLRRPLGLAVIAFAGAVFWFGFKSVLPALGFAVAAWLVAGGMFILVRRWRVGEAEGATVLRLIRTTPLATYGLVLAHSGLGVTTAGISAMSALQSSHILVMHPGQAIDVGNKQLRLIGVRQVQGPNYTADAAQFQLKSGSQLFEMVSERRRFPVSGTQTTEAAIHSTILGNTYVAIGEPDRGGIVVRAYDHPLVGWIWAGALMMALGGIASLSDRRLRVGAGVRRPALAPAAA